MGLEAPTVFVAYAHAGDGPWRATVLDFATALRTVGGIEADLDQWHLIGGEDWITYGPAAIEGSEFIVLAMSATYRDVWTGKNAPGHNPGAAREVAAIQAIFDRDQKEFNRRVKLVILPGASERDVPPVLHLLERFVVRSFDPPGLEPLLRSLLGKPLHPVPPRGPLPALPPYVEGMKPRPDPDGGRTGARTRLGPDAGGDDRASADILGARLAAIDETLASRQSGDKEAGPLGATGDAQLQDERAAVEASLGAVERALGASRQRMVGRYLDAQLYVSMGAYRAADAELMAVRNGLGDPDTYPADCALEPCLRTLTEVMLDLNKRMRARRYSAGTGCRHPEPPPMAVDPEHELAVGQFYDVARSAMKEGASAGSLGDIRRAILRGRKPEKRHAALLYERFTAQHGIAARLLPVLETPSEAGNRAAAHELGHSDLHGAEDRVAAHVLVALAQAHLEVHLVEHRRSGPVAAILNRGPTDLAEDREHLRRSIALSTFAIAISEALPWMFAAHAAERLEAQRDPATSRRELTPAPAVWHARQVTLLALYRRSHGFRLLGDYERAYNDLRMLQRVGRLTRLAHKGDDMPTGWVDTLDALAEYRIGELYRSDHDYMQALVHLCRSHDSVQALENRTGLAIAKQVGQLQVKLSLGKGKAFFDIGAMKRALKWYLAAWRRLLSLESPGSAIGRSIMDVERSLDRVKHDPVLYKEDVQSAVSPVLELMCQRDLNSEYGALEADILVRISHLLTVLRLPEDERDHAPEPDGAAARCLMRAVELDQHNLLVQTELLRYEMRQRGAVVSRTMRDPMDCWLSGAADVDQLIRAAEYLMLERLHVSGGVVGTRRNAVARALMGHFMTHTDSINLRGAILHRYLMRRRAEHREPWWDDDESESRATPGARKPAPPYLEFVCLRRFGSFTPFMPRPAAVSAVGGGYLVRMPQQPSDGSDDCSTMFNIVVDPGEGAVNNLYAMGLSIADIDMVVATHDHPEHLAALDALLSLRREMQGRDGDFPAASTGGAGGLDCATRLLILGNRSVVNRYSFLNGDRRHLVQHIADASVLGGQTLPAGMKITALPSRHKDLGGHDACGFVVALEVPGAEADLRIAFTADTAVGALHVDGEDGDELEVRWASALGSDVVVAHVSDVPSSELRWLAQLPATGDEKAIDKFDAGVKKLADERPAAASQLMHALSLVPLNPGPQPEPVSLLSQDEMVGGDQLYLHGLLEVCELMSKVAAPAGGGTRILIVGELKERLGSFRGTIAREVNQRMLDLPEIHHHASAAPPLIALTADIGLRIRVTAAGANTGAAGRNTVLCSTCSYNNDRLDLERFHPPEDIYEVCVKGDHEAMYWNCDLHDPGQRKRAKFVEQMGGYNPFAAGGRYHG